MLVRTERAKRGCVRGWVLARESGPIRCIAALCSAHNLAHSAGNCRRKIFPVKLHGYRLRDPLTSANLHANKGRALRADSKAQLWSWALHSLRFPALTQDVQDKFEAGRDLELLEDPEQIVFHFVPAQPKSFGHFTICTLGGYQDCNFFLQLAH